ncbi:MAG: hypothetical protein HWN68_09555 [Desulfobacterales bacterium]|nr:hypothetical protein [Desulfobacterales bacterium]
MGSYPPGASRWNPIEHRFFSEISKIGQEGHLRLMRKCSNRCKRQSHQRD